MKTFGKFGVAALAAAALVLGSCNNGAQNNATVKDGADATTANGELKIGYIVYDSIFTQYDFCKESKSALEMKLQNIQGNVSKKEKELQAAAAKFEQDVRSNKYSSQQQAQAVQANIEKQAYDLQMLKENLMNSYAKEEEKLNKQLQEDIDKFIKEYNKDGKYTFIVTKMGDNILYGAPQFNITAEVIEGLNKAHKSKK